MFLPTLKIAMAILLMAGSPQAAEGPETATKTDPPFAAEFAKIKAAADKLMQEAEKGYTNAKTEEEKEALMEKEFARFNREGTPLAEKALALVLPPVQDPAAVEVLTWILTYFSSSPAAGQAVDLLIKHHLTNPKT
jgi:hypothetical protein